MRRIIVESFKDVESYLRGQILKDQLVEEFAMMKSNPASIDKEVAEFVVDQVHQRYSAEEVSDIVVAQAIVVKVFDGETDIVTTDHYVVRYNGMFYDFTAHQFGDAFNNLIKFTDAPVVQPVITNDRQLSSSVSTVKAYALLEYK